MKETGITTKRAKVFKSIQDMQKEQARVEIYDQMPFKTVAVREESVRVKTGAKGARPKCVTPGFYEGFRKRDYCERVVDGALKWNSPAKRQQEAMYRLQKPASPDRRTCSGWHNHAENTDLSCMHYEEEKRKRL